MNKFLKDIFKFIGIFYLIIIVLAAMSNHIISINYSFKIDEKKKAIIIGNSQPECAFNDSIISSLKNLSKSAENYFYNYPKLKKALQQNSQIETVFVEFNPTSIFRREDEKIWRNRYINHHLPNYFSSLDYKDHKLIVLKNPVGYQRALLKSLRNNINRIIINNYDYSESLGGYKYLRRHKINEDPNSIKSNNFKQYNLNEIKVATHNLDYLDKIVQLCLTHDIHIYLIRSPYHERFSANAYETVFQKVRQERYGHIPFLDFKDYELRDEDYGDLQHLNYKGAQKFSMWFNSWPQNPIKKFRDK